MYKIANYSKTDRNILFQNAANKLGWTPIVIEKDFWITVFLDYLFNICKYKDLFVFKGGTCLSKCYKVVNRFSEDIDIVLSWSAIGLNTSEAMKKRSSKQREAFVKEIRLKTNKFLESELIPTLKNDFSKLFKNNLSIELDPNDSRTILVGYDNIYSDNHIKSIIRLEIGCLSSIKPNNIVKIDSYLYNLFPQQFKKGTTFVKAVLAESIFWEKVLILHQNKNKTKLAIHQSRHYYDLASICKTKIKDNALKMPYLLNEAYQITKTFYYSILYKNDNISYEDLELVPNSINYSILENDYTSMEKMILTEPKPSFSNIINEIKNLNKDLKK